MNKYNLTKIENAEIYQQENILDVCLWYPRDNPINTVYLDLCDIRATTPIKITYDFERNGWSILSQTKFNGKTGEATFEEVAFVPYKDVDENN